MCRNKMSKKVQNIKPEKKKKLFNVFINNND